jgi:hypothetical protein
MSRLLRKNSAPEDPWCGDGIKDGEKAEIFHVRKN